MLQASQGSALLGDRPTALELVSEAKAEPNWDGLGRIFIGKPG